MQNRSDDKADRFDWEVGDIILLIAGGLALAWLVTGTISLLLWLL